MDINYIESMRSHISSMEADLVGLTEIISERDLSRYEYKACERLLQTLIEASIGIAKHWCKKLGIPASPNAYDSFQRLHDKGIEDASPSFWRSVIGTRNALVHDYLNIDQEVIESLIRDQQYLSLTKFARTGLTELES